MDVPASSLDALEFPVIRRRSCCDARSTARRAQDRLPRGFFLLSPLAQKVESPAEVGPSGMRHGAGSLPAEDVPLRKDGRQISTEARASELGRPLQKPPKPGMERQAGHGRPTGVTEPLG